MLKIVIHESMFIGVSHKSFSKEEHVCHKKDGDIPIIHVIFNHKIVIGKHITFDTKNLPSRNNNFHETLWFFMYLSHAGFHQAFLHTCVYNNW